MADEVFHQLRTDIITLRLIPGAKISEVEIAKKFGVSRQPVREAFARLSEINFLLIRPQMATRVRKISIPDIKDSRFIRTAVEVEVARRACASIASHDKDALSENLIEQRHIMKHGDFNQFQEVDYTFHQLICNAAGCGPAFRSIEETKSQVDRLCTLALQDIAGMAEIYDDHLQIFEALCARDEEEAVRLIRFHLARLDDTIAKAREYHRDYFED
ncbi:GntR family transcriptional regulator [Harenicola maris]